MAEIELDLRSVPEYAETNLWVCDIEELKEDDEDGDGVPDDCDFLFYGDIIPDGTVEMKKSATEGGKAIFQEVMYDIQEFIPDTTFDGMLTFSIKFGARTVEREECPEGWEVFFKDLRGKSNELSARRGGATAM